MAALPGISQFTHDGEDDGGDSDVRNDNVI